METNECSINEFQFQDSKACMSRHTMNNLNDMRNSNTLCDASIKLDDESKFNVHRNILSACSLYFKALFTTSITDENSNVYISGISKMAMQNILDFAYLRECQLDENNVYEMITISDYVGMMGLVKNCCDFMISILRPENCIEIHLFSKVHNYHDLPNISKQYILQHFVEVAAKSTQIVKMDLKDFYEIISNDKLNVKSEETVWGCCLRWIDFDRLNRIKDITTLMGGVRLGLLNSTYFKEQVRNHPYVINCDEAKPIIIDTLSFLYDLDTMSSRHGEMATPALAVPRIPHEVIFAIGGWSEGVPQKLIETYDTRADRWNRVSTEDPAGPRAYHGTAVINYKIYCIGGFDGVEYFNTCRVFNAFYKTWNQISPMHHKRCYVSVTELNGQIYAMGGYDGINRQNSVERYDPTTNQWTLLAPMLYQRSDADACTFNGLIYMVGGFNGTECLSSCECYDSENNKWNLIPEMFSRRSGVGCIALRGLIYVIGGFNGLSRIRTCERYDPETQMWSLIKEMYSPRSNFGIEIIDDMIFAIGGFNGVVTISHTECYVVETDEWLEATDMSIIRSALSATVLKDLPNIKEYIHQNREKLMEERRLRLISANLDTTDEDEEEFIEEEEVEEI